MLRYIGCIILLVLLSGTSRGDSAPSLIFREGVIVLRNNEALKGRIAIRDYRQHQSRISIYPQGSAGSIRVKAGDILKLEFIYGNPRKIYRQPTAMPIWVTLYRNDGQSYGMCYFNSYLVLYRNSQGQIREFLVHDGFDAFENINSIKTIIFYPDIQSEMTGGSHLIINQDIPDISVVSPPIYPDYTTRKISYIRSKPDGLRIGKLNGNLPLKVIDQQGSWKKVQFEGWIHESLIKPQDSL